MKKYLVLIEESGCEGDTFERVLGTIDSENELQALFEQAHKDFDVDEGDHTIKLYTLSDILDVSLTVKRELDFQRSEVN